MIKIFESFKYTERIYDVTKIRFIYVTIWLRVSASNKTKRNKNGNIVLDIKPKLKKKSF
jgi:hypothetical protein